MDSMAPIACDFKAYAAVPTMMLVSQWKFVSRMTFKGRVGVTSKVLRIILFSVEKPGGQDVYKNVREVVDDSTRPLPRKTASRVY